MNIGENVLKKDGIIGKDILQAHNLPVNEVKNLIYHIPTVSSFASVVLSIDMTVTVVTSRFNINLSPRTKRLLNRYIMNLIINWKN